MTQKITRNRLFYNTYRYCIHFKFDWLWPIRYRTHKEIDRFVDFRLLLQEKYDLEASNYSDPPKRLWGFAKLVKNEFVDEKTRANLHTILHILERHDGKFRLSININNGYIYTNDCSLFEDIFTDTTAMYLYTTEVVNELPEGQIRVKGSAYKYRTYFCDQFIKNDIATKIASYLKSQDTVRISPAMRLWIADRNQISYYSKHAYIRGHYFIDHNDSSVLTFMSLISPIKVKSTLEIINDK